MTLVVRNDALATIYGTQKQNGQGVAVDQYGRLLTQNSTAINDLTVATYPTLASSALSTSYVPILTLASKTRQISFDNTTDRDAWICLTGVSTAHIFVKSGTSKIYDFAANGVCVAPNDVTARSTTTASTTGVLYIGAVY